MTRPSVASLMTVVGAVIVAIIAVYAALQASTLISDATQPAVRATATIGGPLAAPVLNGAYSNAGNRSAELPPLLVPLVQIGGAQFALGGAEIAGTFQNLGSELGVSAPSPANTTQCTPTLSLAPTTSHGFAVIDGMKPFGPSTISVVFAGASSWPAAGLGLMIEPGASSLFTIQVNGTGNTFATVSYENYSLSKGRVVGRFVQSTPFPLDIAIPSTMTLSLTGYGDVTVLVDGVQRLTHAIGGFTPFAVSAEVWSASNSSVLGIVSQVGLSTAWMGATATCGYLASVPLSSDSTPSITSSTTPAVLAGPLPKPRSMAGSLYFLEMLGGGPGSPPDATLTNCTSVSLSPSGTLAFMAPLEV